VAKNWRFYIERPSKGKSPYRSEWLAGNVDRDDMVSEAWALVNDPRDTITCVKVWNERWGMFEPLTFAKGWSADGTQKEKL
jgi:hypothetical protein